MSSRVGPKAGRGICFSLLPSLQDPPAEAIHALPLPGEVRMNLQVRLKVGCTEGLQLAEIEELRYAINLSYSDYK